MINIESYSLFLLLTSNALVLVAAGLALSRFERRCKRIEEFWDSPTGAAMAGEGDEEMREQTQATRRLEQRVGELHRAVKVMEIKTPRQPATIERNLATVERNLPIENAVRMARLGASIEDLTRNCGLNIGEARLMQRLHGKAQMAANASQ